MTIKTNVDKQGRLVIPAEYRKILSITEKTQLEISIVANQIIIKRKISIDSEKITEWRKKIKSLNLKANESENSLYEEKWMSEDYVRNKLGL
ncbi:MAG: Transcriptional regulator MraZ [Candidatus Heimdallarchaeota archaeon LC_3]|nr:MAG: Transcriptional regulator MraZ [Candidatus Heimdallarchaeota archaeon LC_3]